jgi:GNAT superfamily N-acetyltransferase
MDTLIRKAQAKDAGHIAAILRELGWFAQMNSESVEATRVRIAKRLELYEAQHNPSVYVAENADGEIVGYVSVHWLSYLLYDGPEGYISELFVRESGRGQGIGTQLLATVENEARTRGCSRLRLLNLRVLPRGFTGNGLGRKDAANHLYCPQSGDARQVLPAFHQ